MFFEIFHANSTGNKHPFKTQRVNKRVSSKSTWSHYCFIFTFFPRLALFFSCRSTEAYPIDKRICLNVLSLSETRNAGTHAESSGVRSTCIEFLLICRSGYGAIKTVHWGLCFVLLLQNIHKMYVPLGALVFISFFAALVQSVPVGSKGSNETPDTQLFFSPGELPVNHTTFYNALTLFVDTNLEIYAPNVPGDFPVMYFLTGITGIVFDSINTRTFIKMTFTDITPATSYSDFLTHVASHGFVVVGVWKVDSPLNSFNASWLEATIDFVERRLENGLHREGKTIRILLFELHQIISFSQDMTMNSMWIT